MQTTHEEPNLVPLLDLVLQLVMFFMACTNFARENISEAIKLPLSQSARPLEDEELRQTRVFLNVEDTGDVRVRPIVDSTGVQWFTSGKIDGKTAINKIDEGSPEAVIRRKNLDFYFDKVHTILAENTARDMKKGAYKQLPVGDREQVDKALAEKTIMVLRAHQQAEYGDVYEVLVRCRKVGLTRMQLRATIDAR
jgi:biopolymer transport protein ExbD